MNLNKSGMRTALVAMLLFGMIFSGCGNSSSDGASAKSDTTMQSASSDAGSALEGKLAELETDLLEADTTLGEMTILTSVDENADLNFTSLCDFDYGKVNGYFYAYSSDGTAPEISVVELKDSGDASALMKSLKEHVENRRGTMEAYSPDQVDLVEHYVLTYDGNYVTLIISEKSGLVQKAFEASFD